MAQLIRYKSYNILVDGRYWDVLSGRQIVALGFDDFPLDRAKAIVDANFETYALAEIRKLPATKR
jgi:hypothetical protein